MTIPPLVVAAQAGRGKSGKCVTMEPANVILTDLSAIVWSSQYEDPSAFIAANESSNYRYSFVGVVFIWLSPLVEIVRNSYSQ
jgi:hypothetical protein